MIFFAECHASAKYKCKEKSNQMIGIKFSSLFCGSQLQVGYEMKHIP